ncbi:MAG: hypothetical protein ACMVP2_07170 [Imperialibacter sp.]|uniref:hypothetical protein n=1 Tax=Imperialibacter sp. TaxID=2038411 RepID=UPI003A866C2B
MGLYNLHQFEGQLPTTRCVACSSDITPLLGDSGQDCYDYLCKGVCNKQIRITGSSLSDGNMEALLSNPATQIDLREDIINSKDDPYVIYTDTLSYFTGSDYQKSFPTKSYEDWKEGKLPGRPSMYLNLPKNDLAKIAEHQQRIFEEESKIKTSLLIEGLESGLKSSIDPEKFIESESVTIDRLLETNSQLAKRYSIGKIEFDSELSKNIRAFYSQMVKGEYNYDVIINPNQKNKIGKQIYLHRGLVYAKALKVYHGHIKNLRKRDDHQKGSKEASSQQEIDELAEKFDHIIFKLERLEFGQEIIYDEIQPLKEYLGTMPKKTFKDMVVGRLIRLGIDKLLDQETVKEIIGDLFGKDSQNLIQ